MAVKQVYPVQSDSAGCKRFLKVYTLAAQQKCKVNLPSCLCMDAALVTELFYGEKFYPELKKLS